ncbi:MAG TPA: 30S ribosomal protein S4 [Candidatus Aenigmarchaeota archaeon]|nr:30S ribosomal protein S4 [Candidatus Aenigmarchaeota archaeon]
MRRFKKKYQKPKKPWEKARIEEEKKLMKEYGLRRKKEIWRAEAILRKYRRMARELNARMDKEKEKILIQKLIRLGILNNGATLDDVLELSVKDILNRRLQTIVYKKGLANTIKQARQLIVHGHVYIKGRKVIWPSYLVPREEEDKIEVKLKVK